MAKNVTKIPARVNPQTAFPIDARIKRKVAGYARVSTDHDEQLTSYEAQLDYYTTMIQGHEDWEFVGMYSDEERSYPALLDQTNASIIVFMA